MHQIIATWLQPKVSSMKRAWPASRGVVEEDKCSELKQPRVASSLSLTLVISSRTLNCLVSESIAAQVIESPRPIKPRSTYQYEAKESQDLSQVDVAL
jgi:hypothetical protein